MKTSAALSRRPYFKFSITRLNTTTIPDHMVSRGYRRTELSAVQKRAVLYGNHGNMRFANPDVLIYNGERMSPQKFARINDVREEVYQAIQCVLSSGNSDVTDTLNQVQIERIRPLNSTNAVNVFYSIPRKKFTVEQERRLKQRIESISFRYTFENECLPFIPSNKIPAIYFHEFHPYLYSVATDINRNIDKNIKKLSD